MNLTCFLFQVLLAKATDNSVHKDNLKKFCDYEVNEDTYTTKGLLFKGDWGSLRSAANVVFICLEVVPHNITFHYTQSLCYICSTTQYYFPLYSVYMLHL